MVKNAMIAILESLAISGSEGSDLLKAYLKAGYGASVWKIEKIKRELAEDREKKEITKIDKQRYYSLMYKLKKDNLIKETKGGKNMFSITSKGMRRLKKAKESLLPGKEYKKEKSENLYVVMFDIPEKEKRKRSWLRSALKNLEFKIQQRSVWIGKNKIPEELLSDLRELGLIKYVDIFKAERLGSLKRS